MSSEIKRWWDEDRILWYERASETTDFQEKLSKIIASKISKEESILELGTGLGYQGELLHKRGYSIVSYDIDSEAISRAKSRSGLDIFKVSDWKAVKERRDTVLAVFFGRITEEDNLDNLLSLANKHLIYIQSCHRGQNENLRKKGDNTERTIEYLKTRGISFEYEEHRLSFPQKLESREEAIRFIVSFYGSEKLDEYLKYAIETEDERYPIEFRNDKEFILFDIKKENK